MWIEIRQNGIGSPAPSPHSVGLESYTLMLPNEEKRSEMIAQLKRIGTIVNEENGTFITVDPSGNRISLQI